MAHQEIEPSSSKTNQQDSAATNTVEFANATHTALLSSPNRAVRQAILAAAVNQQAPKENEYIELPEPHQGENIKELRYDQGSQYETTFRLLSRAGLMKITLPELHTLDEARDKFSTELNTLHDQLSKIDSTNAEALKAFEDDVYDKLSDFAKLLAEEQLERRRFNTRNLVIESRFESGHVFQGEIRSHKFTAKLTPLYEIKEVEIDGIDILFPDPISIEIFTGRGADEALSAIERFKNLFNVHDFRLIANPSSFDIITGDDREGNCQVYLATSHNIYLVTKGPDGTLISDLNRVRRELDQLLKARLEIEPNGTSAIQDDPQDALAAIDPTKKEMLARIDRDLNVLFDREMNLTHTPLVRELKGIDDFNAREERLPYISTDFKIFHINKDGKEGSAYIWQGGDLSRRQDYENEKVVREVTYSAGSGEPIRIHDFISCTVDHLNPHGRNTFREILESPSSDEVKYTFLCDSNGRVLDHATLESLSPRARIALFEYALMNGSAYSPHEAALTVNACLTAFSILAPNEGLDLLLDKLAKGFSGEILKSAGSILNVGIATQSRDRMLSLLEAAAYQSGDLNAVESALNGRAVLSRNETDRICEAAYKKVRNWQIVDRLSGGKLPRKLLSDASLILNDHALKNWSDIDSAWLDLNSFKRDLGVDESADFLIDLQVKAMIARNLHFQNIEINKDSVKRELGRIVQARQDYGNIEIFRGRNVLLAAGNEQLTDLKLRSGSPAPEKGIKESIKSSGDIYLFGKSGLVEAIRKQQQNDDSVLIERIRPIKTADSVDHSKKQILARIVNMPPPATFIFDGHGNFNLWSLSDDPNIHASDSGELDHGPRDCITADEIADALKARNRCFPQLQEAQHKDRDIMIFASCRSNSFIREIYSKLGDIAKPIAIVDGEYHQQSFSDPSSPYGTGFFSHVLNMKKHLDSGDTSKLGDVFRNEWYHIKSDWSRNTPLGSNPTIYIIDEDNRPRQITEVKQPSHELKRFRLKLLGI